MLYLLEFCANEELLVNRFVYLILFTFTRFALRQLDVSLTLGAHAQRGLQWSGSDTRQSGVLDFSVIS